MHLTITTEARYAQGPDGALRSSSATTAYGFWAAYLGPFDSVTVLARVGNPPNSSGRSSMPVEGPGVTVHPVRNFVGLAGFLRAYAPVRRDVREAIAKRESAWLVRTPGLLSQFVIRELSRASVGYGVEVVGDPTGVLRSGVPPVIGPLLANVAGMSMARACRRAIAASYVTESQLQLLYPPGGSLRAVYSSVDLPPEAYVPSARARAPGDTPHLLAVGTHTQRYKGHDVLIDAVTLLHERGRRVRLSIAGDGRYQPWLRERAAASPAGPDIEFLGDLPTAGVRDALDHCDVFVLPSKTEGLPRALIEAMARAVPCVASAVGGVPELLPAERLVPPGDPVRLADRLAALLADPEAMAADSRRNLTAARRYSRSHIHAARTAFLTDFQKLHRRNRHVFFPCRLQGEFRSRSE